METWYYEVVSIDGVYITKVNQQRCRFYAA